MFRFTIRDVLWLTVVVGLAVAWWVDRYDITKERKSLVLEREVLRAEQEALRAKVRRVDENLSNRTRALYFFESRLLERLKGNAPLTEDELARLRSEVALLGPPLPQPTLPSDGHKK